MYDKIHYKLKKKVKKKKRNFSQFLLSLQVPLCKNRQIPLERAP